MASVLLVSTESIKLSLMRLASYVDEIIYGIRAATLRDVPVINDCEFSD
jgi:hypothetical protein